MCKGGEAIIMAKKHGHYCKVCGEYKSNESFSGKGHNAHICKKCAALSPPERSAEMTMTRLLNLPYRLSSEQRAWLKGLQQDKRPEIAETAKAVYAERFPYAERNERKKQLHIKSLTVTVHDELWDEYGDPFDAHLTFILDRQSRTLSYTQDADANTAELSGKEMTKLLSRIINEYEIFCWDEDFSRSDLYPFDDEDDYNEAEAPSIEDHPSWTVSVSYTNGEEQQMKGYDIPFRINDLVTDLLQYFADEEDEDFED